jgi:aromatic-L-amino-acid decarboxylase
MSLSFDAGFRAHAHRLADWMADYLETIETRRPAPAVGPGTVRRALPPTPPETAASFAEILEDFERVILPATTHWQHPRWFAYFPANTSPASVLAEMLTAVLGANCIAWEACPAGTELEQVTLDWLRQLLGWPDTLTGMIQDTASTATLSAVLVGRDEAWRRLGRDARLVFYASEEAHYSVPKAARLAGFPPDCIRLLATDRDFALRPDALADAMAADAREGRAPAVVVATVGTTSSTGLDPLRPIGELCRAYDAYLHVDAAWAGAASILPEQRPLFDGLELAHSVVVNPHKWLGVGFDCSAHYVRDVNALRRTFAAAPAYLPTDTEPEVVQYRDWGIPLGRRFRALKLWMVLRAYGAEGLRAMIREHIRLGTLFAAWVDAHPAFERLAPAPLGLVCFRHRPSGMDDEAALDAHNRALLQRLNAEGRVYLTGTVLRGRYALRLAIGQRNTRERHVRDAWDAILSATGGGDSPRSSRD